MKKLFMWVFGNIFSFLFKGGGGKFVFFFILYELVKILFTELITLLPSWFQGQQISFNFGSPGLWYFFDYASGATAIPMLLTAVSVKFIIRRIPFIN